MKDFGILIKTLRKEANLTQKELADKLGIDDSNISKWERGKTLPDISIFPQIAAVLNVKCDELLHPAETLQKMNKSSGRNTLSKNDDTGALSDNTSEPVVVAQRRMLFTTKRVLFACMIAVVLVMGIFIYSYTQTKFTFIEVHTNVETSYGPAYELVYYHKAKSPTYVFIEHADSLLESWQNGTYTNSTEDVLIITYYRSKDSINNWEDAYFQMYYYPDPPQ